MGPVVRPRGLRSTEGRPCAIAPLIKRTRPDAACAGRALHCGGLGGRPPSRPNRGKGASRPHSTHAKGGVPVPLGPGQAPLAPESRTCRPWRSQGPQNPWAGGMEGGGCLLPDAIPAHLSVGSPGRLHLHARVQPDSLPSQTGSTMPGSPPQGPLLPQPRCRAWVHP